jgi:hypothetical protein
VGGDSGFPGFLGRLTIKITITNPNSEARLTRAALIKLIGFGSGGKYWPIGVGVG